MLEQGETDSVATMADGKCPYLAGRPPHGTYKLWPSSINVCYGRPAEGKPYGQVSKETQGRDCFSGESVFCTCAHYQRAVETSIAPPEFGRAWKPEEETAAGESTVRRVRKRRRKKHRQNPELLPVFRTVAFVATLLLTLGLVAMVMTR